MNEDKRYINVISHNEMLIKINQIVARDMKFWKDIIYFPLICSHNLYSALYNPFDSYANISQEYKNYSFTDFASFIALRHSHRLGII